MAAFSERVFMNSGCFFFVCVRVPLLTSSLHNTEISHPKKTKQKAKYLMFNAQIYLVFKCPQVRHGGGPIFHCLVFHFILLHFSKLCDKNVCPASLSNKGNAF